MFTTIFGRSAARNAKRGRPTARHYRALRLEPLEARQLLTTSGFTWTGPTTTSPAAAGVPDSFQLAEVYKGSPVTTANLTFSSNDPQAVLPASVSYDLADTTFNATFKTAGPKETLTVTDKTTKVHKTFTFLVTPGTAALLSVTGLPPSTAVGTANPLTVTALDTYGNIASSYRGTVQIASNSDPLATLTNAGATISLASPYDYTFTASDAGTHQFQITFFTQGTIRSVTVADTSNSRLTDKVATEVTGSTAVRYASTSNTIYVESGTMTLSQIHALLPSAPLVLVDAATATWELNADLVVQNGATLQVHGTSIGGDVNQLRLESNNTAGGKVFVSIAADYGTIDINSTAITSWDEAAKVPGPDKNFEDGRAYIRASSTLAADGVTPQDSTLNILNSNIGYLGYYTEEAYGLSWKVEGNPGPGHGAISNVHVYGNVENDKIHNNFFGVYTYGLQGDYGAFTNLKNNSGLFKNDDVYNNVDYGLDFHNYSDGISVQGNDVHNNGLSATQYHIGWVYYEKSSDGPGPYTPATALYAHGIIFSIGCVGNVISDNQSVDNLGHGIMVHRANADNDPADSTFGTVVSGNTTTGNSQEGIAIYDSNNNTITKNIVENNALDGIRFTVAASNNTVSGNTISGNLGYGIEMFPATDASNMPSQGGNGHPDGNTVSGNTITDNQLGGISLEEADQNTFQGNTIYGNQGAAEVLVSTSVGNVFSGNNFTNPATNAPDGNAILSSTGSSTINSDTIINSQPALTVSLDKYSTLTFNGTSSGASFSLMPASATLNLNLQAGNLTPSQSYSVSRNGTVIGTFTANANGFIQFSDAPDTTALVTYDVQSA